MQALVIYDIPDDRLRGKVADLCQDYGLQRIQYSAFLGPITRNRQQELLLKIKRQAGTKPIDVSLFVVCARDLELRLGLCQKADDAGVPPPTPLRRSRDDRKSA